MRKFEEFKEITNEEEMAERNDTYILFEETRAVMEEATELIVEPLMKKGEDWIEYDSVLGKIASEYATAGFINGYKAAMRLLREAVLI